MYNLLVQQSLIDHSAYAALRLDHSPSSSFARSVNSYFWHIWKATLRFSRLHQDLHNSRILLLNCLMKSLYYALLASTVSCFIFSIQQQRQSRLCGYCLVQKSANAKLALVKRASLLPLPNFFSLNLSTLSQSLMHSLRPVPSLNFMEATFSRLLQVMRFSSPNLFLRSLQDNAKQSSASSYLLRCTSTAPLLLRITDYFQTERLKTSLHLAQAFSYRDRLLSQLPHSQQLLARLIRAIQYSSSSSQLRLLYDSYSINEMNLQQQRIAFQQIQWLKLANAASLQRYIMLFGISPFLHFSSPFMINTQRSSRDFQLTSFRGLLGMLLGGNSGSLAVAILLNFPVKLSSDSMINFNFSSVRWMPILVRSSGLPPLWIPMQKCSYLPFLRVLMKIGEPLWPPYVAILYFKQPFQLSRLKRPLAPNCLAFMSPCSSLKFQGQPYTLISVFMLVQFSKILIGWFLRGVSSCMRQMSNLLLLAQVIQPGCTLNCFTLKQFPSRFCLNIASIDASPFISPLMAGQNSIHSANSTCLNTLIVSSTLRDLVVSTVEARLKEEVRVLCKCSLYFFWFLLNRQRLWAAVSTRSSPTIAPVPMVVAGWDLNLALMRPMNQIGWFQSTG